MTAAAPQHTPTPTRLPLGVRSETAPLRHVLVHTPGVEMDHVAPGERENLLFEDILYVEHAQAEHRLMTAVIDKVVGEPHAAVQITDLLREAFLQDEAREDFVGMLCRLGSAYNFQAFEDELKQLDPSDLHAFALTGAAPFAVHAPPVPNLMFTRDLCAVVSDHAILSHPATSARMRESIMTRIVFRYHPAFSEATDRLIELPEGVTFEGGDLLLPAPGVVLIGHSARTSLGGVMSVVREVLGRGLAGKVVVMSLPAKRSYMHLDTVFTFAEPDACVYFPPLFAPRGLANVLTYEAGAGESLTCTVFPSLQDALQDAVGHDITFFPCGGDDLLSQQREQWTDGANFFAIAPGVVIGYERNPDTFETLRRAGYRVVTARGFLSYYAESPYELGEKVAIKLDGHELSRGRGGPRCMTMPICRSDAPRS